MRILYLQLTLLLYAFLFIQNAKGQEQTLANNRFRIGAQIPLYYSISYEEKIWENLNLGIQGGWLKDPFTQILIKEAKRRDLDNELGTIIQDQFSLGYNVQPFLNYRFKHFYIGASYSYTSLTATDLPYDKLANIYNIDLNSYLNNNPFFLLLLKDIELNSILHLPGLFVGREFQFNKPHFMLGVEIGFQKIVATKNALTYGANKSEMPIIADVVNNDLNDYYLEEGNIPSLNVYFVYRFKKSLNRAISRLSKSSTKE